MAVFLRVVKLLVPPSLQENRLLLASPRQNWGWLSWWCLYFLIGVVGHLFPGLGIQKITFPPTSQFPEGRNLFPAFDLVDPPLTAFIAILAIGLIALQTMAILFRDQASTVIVGCLMLLLGLPIILRLIPARIEDAHDFIWDECFPIALHGSFLFSGVSMLIWSYRLTGAAETQKQNC